MSDPKSFHDIMKMADEALKKSNPNASLPNMIVTAETYDEKVEVSALTKDIVTDLNGWYLIHGEYPTLDKLKERFPQLLEIGPVGLEKLFKDANEILEEKRGLPPYEIEFKTVKTWDPQFIAACNILMDVSDKRSTTAKLKDVGLTTRRWNNMLRSKKNLDYWEQCVDMVMDRDTWQESRIALARNVSQGDLPSIKYFHELTGKFTASKDFDPRILTHVILTMLEIVSKHVDGNTARKIADEIEVSAVKELGIG